MIVVPPASSKALAPPEFPDGVHFFQQVAGGVALGLPRNTVSDIVPTDYWFFRNPRHPPKEVMSFACSSAAGSQIKPFTEDPSDR